MKDTLQIVADGTSAVSQTIEINWWMVVAFAELVFIIILLFILLRGEKNNAKSTIKQQVKNEGDIDFRNVIISSFGAEPLYRELIRKCHPDRFAPDEEKMAIANDITERLGKCKNDIQKLNEIKTEAINKLNINL